MGYRITYENGHIHKKTIRSSQFRWKRWGAGAAVAALAVTLLIPRGRLWVRDLLLPGDEDVTAAALGSLVEDLSAGEPVGEAVQTFCREIIHGDRT